MCSLQNCVVVVLFLTKSCLTLCSPMDSSPPGSSVHGTSQARIPEWVVIAFFRGSSQPRDVACISCISCIGRQIFYHWATRKHQNCQRIYFYWLKPHSLWSFAMAALGFMAISIIIRRSGQLCELAKWIPSCSLSASAYMGKMARPLHKPVLWASDSYSLLNSERLCWGERQHMSCSLPSWP